MPLPVAGLFPAVGTALTVDAEGVLDIRANLGCLAGVADTGREESDEERFPADLLEFANNASISFLSMTINVLITQA